MKNSKMRIITVLLISIVLLGVWKYIDNIHKQQFFSKEINQPITQTISPDVLKHDDIKQFTDNDLMKYKKQALDNNLDKYANAYLEIPSIDVHLPVYARANNQTLALGLGKDYYLDSEFGHGNVVLAGHNMERRHVLLSDLNNVKIGDVINVNDGKKYTYRIIRKFVSNPTIKIINNKPDKDTPYYLPNKDEKPLLTLYTCTVGGQARLVVQAELE